MNSFGERLRMLRKEKRMSLDELGEKLGLPKSSLSRYENNDMDPSIETAKKIAIYFNVTLDWLAGLSDTKESTNYNYKQYADDILQIAEECAKYNVSADKIKKIIDLLKE